MADSNNIKKSDSKGEDKKSDSKGGAIKRSHKKRRKAVVRTRSARKKLQCTGLTAAVVNDFVLHTYHLICILVHLITVRRGKSNLQIKIKLLLLISLLRSKSIC